LGNSLSPSQSSPWLDSKYRAATRAASAFAFSRLSLPSVALRVAGEGGWTDLSVVFQAGRMELSSAPPKRIFVRLFVVEEATMLCCVVLSCCFESSRVESSCVLSCIVLVIVIVFVFVGPSGVCALRFDINN